MLIDLLLVVVLAGALWRREGAASTRAVVVDSSASLRRFSKALLRARLGRLLVLLAIATGLQWAAQIATSGWRSLDPAVATGALSEEERCHAWQRRIEEATTVDAFAPSELICPVGGGRYTRTAAGRVSCGLHGAAP